MARKRLRVSGGWLAVVLVALAATPLLAQLAAGGGPATQPAERPAEKWVSLPPQQWPQIMLTHEAKFRGNRSLEGASAFLVRLDSRRILAVTAKHLLGEAGGVEPPIKLAEVNTSIISWVLHPRTARTPVVALDKLAISTENEADHDLVALTVKNANVAYAVLKIRPDPVVKGEKVFLVGAPYSEPRSRQNVYPGEVLHADATRVNFSMKPPLVTRGFSGAPLIDAKGYAVGVYRGSINKDASGASSEGVAQSMQVLLRLLTVK